MPRRQRAKDEPDAPVAQPAEPSFLLEWPAPEALERAPRLSTQPNPSGHMLLPEDDHEPGLEKFRFLGHRLNQLRQHRSVRSILVTSAIPKEGKTVVAANLAQTLVRMSPRVLLVDGDLRAPKIHSVLGVPPLPGLAEFLEGRSSFSDVVCRVDPDGWYYLPAGHPGTNPVELLEGERAGAFLRTARNHFDWVVLDSPPLLPFADACCLARMVDAVLLVARPGFTLRKDLQRAVSALDGVYLAGVVLNAHDEPRQNYYYSYYRRAPAAGPET